MRQPGAHVAAASVAALAVAFATAHATATNVVTADPGAGLFLSLDDDAGGGSGDAAGWEPVYQPLKDGCPPLDPRTNRSYDFPDSMPIAFYDRARGQAHLLSAHGRGHQHSSVAASLEGPLSHDCSVEVFTDALMSTPESYANYQWMQAVRVLENGTAVALLHNEFKGEMDPSGKYCSCITTETHPNYTCTNHCELWSTGLATSADGGRTFALVRPPPGHLVAALPQKFSFDQELAGYGAVGPIHRGSDGAYYGVININAMGPTALPPGQLAGNCPFRTDDLFDPQAYRPRDAAGGFSGHWASPYSSIDGSSSLGGANSSAGLCAVLRTNLSTAFSEHVCVRRLVAAAGVAAGGGSEPAAAPAPAPPGMLTVGTGHGLDLRYAFAQEGFLDQALESFGSPKFLPLADIHRWLYRGEGILYPVVLDTASPALGVTHGDVEEGDNFNLVGLPSSVAGGNTSASTLYVYVVVAGGNILRRRVSFSSTAPAPAPTPPPPAATCTAFQVTGAGWADYDGVYTLVPGRVVDDAPFFQKDSTHHLYRFGGVWVLAEFDVVEVYASAAANTSLPSAADWGLRSTPQTPAPASVTCVSVGPNALL